jgi:hypothetical protein
MAVFKGIVKLSQEQYESLKTNGSLTVGETTITYDPKTTLYVTPSAGGGSGVVDLTEYVKNTDYATSDKGGVFRLSGTYGFGLTSSGTPTASTFTKEDYTNKSVGSFISKGTLENIKNDYVKEGMTTNTAEWTDEEKASARTLIGATNLNTHANYGVQNNATGLVMVVKATDDEITNKSTAYKPIVPTNLDFAIVQGLANNSITLTDDQKTAVQTWLGVSGGSGNESGGKTLKSQTLSSASELYTFVKNVGIENVKCVKIRDDIYTTSNSGYYIKEGEMISTDVSYDTYPIMFPVGFTEKPIKTLNVLCHTSKGVITYNFRENNTNIGIVGGFNCATWVDADVKSYPTLVSLNLGDAKSYTPTVYYFE